MINQKKIGKSTLSKRIYASSYLLEEKLLRKYMNSKIPLLFNLYENRFIHSIFLEIIFEDLLKTQEFLEFNFQTRILSIFNAKNIRTITFFYKLKIIFIIILVTLLIRSFPYGFVFNENKNFFVFHLNKYFRIFRLPLSLCYILVNKLIIKIKTTIYIVSRILKNIFFNSSYRMLKYFRYNLIKNIAKDKTDYRKIVQSYQNLKFLKNLEWFFVFWICLNFNHYIKLYRFFVKLSSKIEDQKAEKLNGIIKK